MWVAAVVLTVLMAGHDSASSQPGPKQRLVVFYDPDANHKLIINTTALINGYFADQGQDIRLQPVTTSRDFESLMRSPDAGFAIVASDYLKQQGNQALQPQLVPSSEGSVTYRKLLVHSGGVSGSNLKGKRIAASATATDPRAASDAILAQLKAENLDVQGAIVIPVSKDIDALLALSFGQADLALVTPASLEVLQRINPRAAAKTQILLTTRPVLRSPMCTISGRSSPAEQARVLDGFLKMHENEAGRRALKTMGVDRWVPFKPEMVQ